MSDVQILKSIESRINDFQTGNLKQNTINLFKSLGYNSPHQMDNLFSNTAYGFLDYLKENNSPVLPNQNIIEDWISIDFCMQLTHEDIKIDKIKDKNFDSQINSYLLFCIELKNPNYPNRVLADICRVLNRIFPKPVFILFKYGNNLTLSIINRRKNKNDNSKDVLEKVTLIKDINIQNTHRAQIEILFDLSLEELNKKNSITNFDDLHKAWQSVLNISELNKKFYKEISNWYFWARENVTFPNNNENDAEITNSTNLIRLLTRLIFVWFLKEKQLVPNSLFDKMYLDKILIKNDKNDSTYYKAILQNLFFATLNQEMNTQQKPDNRKFRNDKQHYNITNLYRYKTFFTDEQTAIKLFSEIPFLNGGLFECLDKIGNNPSGKEELIRIDGFSDRPDNILKVPDFLFFSEYQAIDLSTIYQSKNKKEKVRGIINILNNYKFTIAENTPIEEEVALDPELLGKVFENLLASYNPETGTTARKQTGSFYTPREIVNYMVDESLIAYLTQTLSEGEGLNTNKSSKFAYITTTPERWNYLIQFAKQNRSNPTKAEKIIWNEVRNRKLGDKFRRQHPIEDFIVDFVCLEKKLVLEIDGDIHNNSDIAEYDQIRSENLKKLGYRVIRYNNNQVINQLDWVINKIKEALNSPSPLEKGQGVEVLGLEDRLRILLSYSLDNPNFTEDECQALLSAIDNCKILDPACGSGAFPMGILHKMVHIIHKLDPNNEKWKQRQLDKASQIDDAKAREIAIDTIEEAFDKNELDYGRKLFLIENCIYGIDIQAIAVQISKLRFFISLIVDQKVDSSSTNFGIRPLPNLETKFVAANSLIGLEIEKNQKSLFENNKIDEYKEQLKKIRHQYFEARTPKTKEKYRNSDRDIRKKLAFELEQSRYCNHINAAKISEWNPYDQNASASWFDSEWMFGVVNGFDIVIGNPPYGFRNVLTKAEKDYFRKIKNIEFSSGDSAELFCKISFNQLLKENGIITFIVPKKSLYGDAWEDVRVNYWKKYDLAFILDTGKSFDNVLLEASVFGLIKKETSRNVNLAFLENDLSIKRFSSTDKSYFFIENNTCQIYKVLYPFDLFEKIKNKSFNSKKIQSKLGLAIGQDFFSNKETDFKLLKGIDIEQYRVRSHRYLKNHEKLNWKNIESFLKPKIVAQVIVSHIENPRPHLKIIACFDNVGIPITNTLMALETDSDIQPKFFLCYLNSKFVSWYAYNFIYSQAIRTMHFYDFYIQQLPIPRISFESQNAFLELLKSIISKKEVGFDITNEVMHIDIMVYKIYELTFEEVKIIDPDFSMSQEEYDNFEIES